VKSTIQEEIEGMSKNNSILSGKSHNRELIRGTSKLFDEYSELSEGFEEQNSDLNLNDTNASEVQRILDPSSKKLSRSKERVSMTDFE
jgi:hypothetical protein